MKRKNLPDHVKLANNIQKNILQHPNNYYGGCEFYKVSDILGAVIFDAQWPTNPGKAQQLVIKAMDLLVERGILLRPDPIALKWKYRYYVKPPKYVPQQDPKVNRCPRCNFVVTGKIRRHGRGGLPHTLEECQLNKVQGILDA